MNSPAKFCLLALLVGGLSACEMLPSEPPKVASVCDIQPSQGGIFSPSAYYLRLMEMSEDQIFNELESLSQDPRLADNPVKLGLLYAYKKSPVKNPHRAHAAFNQAFASQGSLAQQGMLVALNDQLADALKWQHRYENLGIQQQQQQQLLQQQIALLRQQLDELTRIEQQLNERN